MTDTPSTTTPGKPTTGAAPRTTSEDLAVNFAEIEAAATRLQGIARLTPVHQSRQLDTACNAQVMLKCENFQNTGSFKFRGAYNSLLLLKEAGHAGVVAFSSGNHAQAVALAGSMLGLATTIVMPNNAPKVKAAATRGYGASIVEYNPSTTQREKLAAEIAESSGLPVVPAYDYPHVIAGQGTAAKELFEEVGELDVLLVCCGGGGLLSGSCLSAAALSPDCRVIGVEPALGDDGARSFRSGRIETVHNPATIADGARTPYLGDLTFPIIQRYASDIVTVSDAALIETLRFLWERLKLIVEPTGALALAALLSGTEMGHLEIAPGARVGVTISGGNVDVSSAATLFGNA